MNHSLQKTKSAAGWWQVLSLCVLVGLAVPLTCAAAIIDDIEVDLTYFSPNGDDIQDEVTFTYSLSESATVRLVVVTKDSSTVVNTLVDDVLQVPNIDFEAMWNGMTSLGVLAPEDTFLVSIRATSMGGAEIDTVFSRFFFLDVTPPFASITDISPEIFAPGSTDPPIIDSVLVEYDIQDPPPSDEVAVQVVIFDQTPKEVATLRSEIVPSIGTYEDTWDGSGTTVDGDHTVEVFVKDEAGNENRVSRTFDVSLSGPEITITNLETGLVLQELPDSLYGKAWHRHGTHDSLWVRFSTPTNVNEPWVKVMTTYFRDDTLFFSSPLASIVDEQEIKYTFSFRAKNLLGQEQTASIDVTWDQTPPPWPVLEQPEPVTYSPDFVLNGQIDDSVGFEDIMRIYQNDALVDTIFPAVPGHWPHAMTLTAGLNEIYAVIVDKAGNTSLPSNTITVTWDRTRGFFIQQPFRPGDAFYFNVGKTVTSLMIRVYDLGGNLVAKVPADPINPLSSGGGSDASIPVPWNGLNGDGVSAKKGPLVAVASLQFDDGTSDTQRKIFLFEP